MASNPTIYQETRQFDVSGTNFLVSDTLHTLRVNTGRYMYLPYYDKTEKKWTYYSINNFKIGSTENYLNRDGSLSANGGTTDSLLCFTPFIADLSDTDYRPCGNNLTTIYGVCASVYDINYSYSINIPPIYSSTYAIYSGVITKRDSTPLSTNKFSPYSSLYFRTNQLNFIFNRADYYIPFVFFGVSGHYDEAFYFDITGTAWTAEINATISDFGLQNLSNTAYQNGYNQGTEDAKATNNAIDLIAHSFNQMADILATPLLPGFSLGGLISIPLVVTLITFFFRMIKGGN